MSIFLGIDLGTSYFKAALFDGNGRILGSGRQYVEKMGDGVKCELPVAVFWKTLRSCVAQALKEAKMQPEKITALSYSSQANSFVLIDRGDKPLTPLILWPDERVREIPVSLQALAEKPDFPGKTGLGIRPGKHSLLAKIDWHQRMQPQVWEKIGSIMSISDYLIFSLTGHKISDWSTSSMTGLLDVPEGKWWREAADIFNIDAKNLSTPLQTGTLAGKLTRQGAELAGLTQKTTLFLGGLDHHMAAVGAGLPCYNYMSESTGTVLACINYQNGYRPRTGINIARGLDGKHYFQMAFDNNGAAALEWYQETFAPTTTIQDLLQQAEGIQIGCNGLVAKPKANEYPGLNGFKNIGEIHQKAHFVRSILESTGVSLLYLAEALDENNLAEAIVPSGGGAKSRLWLQIKANLLNKVFLVPESGELACTGAAMLCAVGTACFGSIQEAVEKQVNFKEKIYPDEAEAENYTKWHDMIKNNR